MTFLLHYLKGSFSNFYAFVICIFDTVLYPINGNKKYHLSEVKTSTDGNRDSYFKL